MIFLHIYLLSINCAGRVPDVVDDCDAANDKHSYDYLLAVNIIKIEQKLPCESRRPTLLRVGARSVGCSGKSDETLPKLPCRPIEPGPGVLRSGIGGGTPLTDGRLLRPADEGVSSVGLPRDDTDERDTVLAIAGRQTFCMRDTTNSAIWRRSSSCVSPINAKVQSVELKIYSRPSFPTATDSPQISMPPNNSDTFKYSK